ERRSRYRDDPAGRDSGRRRRNRRRRLEGRAALGWRADPRGRRRRPQAATPRQPHVVTDGAPPRETSDWRRRHLPAALVVLAAGMAFAGALDLATSSDRDGPPAGR